MLLALTHGLMGILPTGTYWRVGAVFSAIFLTALVALSGPFILR